MLPSKRLNEQFPWTGSPLIANAPMSGFAGIDLAVAVTRAGGLGQIGFDYHRSIEHQLRQARELLQDIDTSSIDDQIIPLGVGIIVFGADLTTWSRMLSRHKPAMIWLFAAKKIADYATWTHEIRRVSPNTRVWVQLGSIEMGMRVAKNCQPDCIVMQGSDAGGHGNEHGASIISLVPEMCDALREANLSDRIAVVAAGGIADARAVLAALMLGAEGVVMGTRFLAANETIIDDENRALILKAIDGGQSTVRTKLFDELFGLHGWPKIYDGRGLVNQSYLDQKAGMPPDQVMRRFMAAMQDGDDRWNVVWSGSGVGMVKKQESAAEIMRSVFRDIAKRVEESQALLQP